MKSTKSPSWIKRLLGLDPAPVPPNVFRLRQERLDFCRFNPVEGRLSLGEFRSLDLPPNLFQPGLLGGPAQDPVELERQVGELVRSLDSPVKAASLVLPDAWLRLSFAESAELPKSEKAREDVLRWKLKRLVPFRVEELRIQGAEVTPLVGQEEPKRLLLGFAVEPLLKQLEKSFAAVGVRIGQITNESLAVLGALGGAPDSSLHGLVVAGEAGYSLVAARNDEPVVHRYKAHAEGGSPEARARRVRRDLMLTRTFLEHQMPGVTFSRVVLAVPEDEEAAWHSWVHDSLEMTPQVLGREQMSVIGAPQLSWSDIAPMLGAANREVA